MGRTHDKLGHRPWINLGTSMYLYIATFLEQTEEISGCVAFREAPVQLVPIWKNATVYFGLHFSPFYCLSPLKENIPGLI